ncbi:hypothetical protein ACLOAV_005869 [Pseudogymnoascus australis]
MREDLKDKSLSFTELTKVVGRKWQCLTPSEKEPCEQQSFAEKETSTTELAEYITTESYKTYSDYLLGFKAKQLRTQESNRQSPNETSKVPKFQNTPAPAGSPGTTCNTVVGTNAQTLAWSSQARPKGIPIPEYSQQNRRDASLSGMLNGPNSPLGVGQILYNQPRSVGAFTPPSLTSKSTLSNMQSTLSTESGDSQSQRSSATYFAPQKPLEQPCDRLFLPIPQNFSDTKASAVLGFHKANTRILAMDYSSVSQASQRSAYYPSSRTALSYQPASLQQHNIPTMDDELTSLDPISALLRADEIFSSEGRLDKVTHYVCESERKITKLEALWLPRRGYELEGYPQTFLLSEMNAQANLRLVYFRQGTDIIEATLETDEESNKRLSGKFY